MMGGAKYYSNLVAGDNRNYTYDKFHFENIFCTVNNTTFFKKTFR